MGKIIRVFLKDGSYREYSEWESVSSLVGLQDIRRIEAIAAGEPQYEGLPLWLSILGSLVGISLVATIVVLVIRLPSQAPVNDQAPSVPQNGRK
ncbi:MAG: hypothetical protein HC919_06045 [Oscillatoriales cyanobacterium SM2_2_1]|nr:hypothetical protein [Oscillatoriales cyanobacterium SM2_2_1]